MPYWRLVYEFELSSEDEGDAIRYVSIHFEEPQEMSMEEEETNGH